MATFTLGAFASSLTGKSGNVVYARTASGIVVRNLPRVNNPQTVAQHDNRHRMSQAVRAWSDLEPGIAARWRAYAESLAVTDPASGLPKVPKAMNVFTSLYAKLLQLDPTEAPPENPPGNPFFGDSVVVTVSAMGDSQNPSPFPRACAERERGQGVRVVPALYLHPHPQPLLPFVRPPIRRRGSGRRLPQPKP